jgi:mono/diheme cytochrome c family protein
MRHAYAYRIAYVIAAMLVLTSLFFAWIRSQQIVIVPEEDILADEEVTDIADFEWQALGANTYDTNCATCHGSEGQGRDVYPGLQGTPGLLAAEGGRTFLVDIMLYGLESDRHDAAMPAFDTLSDARIAAVLNHTLTSWGNEERLPEDAELYLPGEVAEERGKELSPADVGEMRRQLGP